MSVEKWIAGGLRVSPRLVSSRFVSAMLLSVVCGREDVRAVVQQYAVLEIDGWCCCGALHYPWQGRENTRDGNAGRAGRGDNGRAQYAGSTWRTQHAARQQGNNIASAQGWCSGREAMSGGGGGGGGGGGETVVMVAVRC